MHTITVVLLSLFATLPLSASNLWFDPPNPTSRTFVTARIQVMTGCPVSGVEVARTEQAISIVVTQFEVCPAIPAPIEGYPVSADLGRRHCAVAGRHPSRRVHR